MLIKAVQRPNWMCEIGQSGIFSPTKAVAIMPECSCLPNFWVFNTLPSVYWFWSISMHPNWFLSDYTSFICYEPILCTAALLSICSPPWIDHFPFSWSIRRQIRPLCIPPDGRTARLFLLGWQSKKANSTFCYQVLTPGLMQTHNANHSLTFSSQPLLQSIQLLWRSSLLAFRFCLVEIPTKSHISWRNRGRCFRSSPAHRFPTSNPSLEKTMLQTCHNPSPSRAKNSPQQSTEMCPLFTDVSADPAWLSEPQLSQTPVVFRGSCHPINSQTASAQSGSFWPSFPLPCIKQQWPSSFPSPYKVIVKIY